MKKTLNRSNIMYLPAVVLILCFIVYPFLRGFPIAMTNWNGFSQESKFVGFENFISLLKDPNVKKALTNTLIYGFASTFFQQILGLGYALLLNMRFKLSTFGRTMVYLPVLIPGLIMGYMWFFMVRFEGGAINDFLNLLGIESIFWLGVPSSAVGIIITINVIQFVGTSMLIYLAGLQGISDMYYEAAKIDGASKMEQFKHITLPLLIPSITTSSILNLIGGLKLFDLIIALTKGGPNYSTHSLATLINETYFQGQNAGYASAIGILLFIVVLLVTVIVQKILKKIGDDTFG